VGRHRRFGTAECGGTAGYLACSQTALDATASTGDAGSRVACGVIQ
jgi:Cu/Zn superoxide dismutase